jgi:heme oxygenase
VTEIEDGDVLRRVRAATAREHRAVEDVLGLTDPGLTRDRLVDVLGRLHGFWCAAETGLDAWASVERDAAADVRWDRRRRAHLYAADLAALGAAPASPPDSPVLPDMTDTDSALGRLYVLEGSTLGGVFIDRHLATLPQLAPPGGLRAFSPYGDRTGPMWRGYRRAVRARMAGGGDADRLVDSARSTFAALATWGGTRPAGAP